MWQKVMKAVKEDIPPFNDDLLRKFRKRKLDSMDVYLDDVVRIITQMTPGVIQFVGHTTLTPEERLAYMTSNTIEGGKVDIQESTTKIIKMEFKFQGASHFMHITLPVMDHGVIMIRGSPYYPTFPIVEAGGVHVKSNEVTVKVMRATTIFKREDPYSVVSTNGKVFRECVITTKIHHGKSKTQPPSILYHLATIGLENTLRLYAFDHDELLITDEPGDVSGYTKFKIDRSQFYIQIKDTALADMYKLRVMIGLLICLAQYPIQKIHELYEPTAVYFKVVLGRYTHPTLMSPSMLIDQTSKHLMMNETLLDPLARIQLAQVNINARSIYELLHYIFYNIDRMLSSQEPTNLWTKQIGSLDIILAPLIRELVLAWYNRINNEKEPLTHDNVKKLLKRRTSCTSLVQNSVAFNCKPSLYNDNALISIWSKYFRTLESIEAKGKGRRGRGSASVPKSDLKIHPSYLTSTSILCIPTSNPCRTGNINPYLQITSEGAIVPPADTKEIDHIFD